MRMIPADSANHYVAGTVAALAGLVGGGLLGALLQHVAGGMAWPVGYIAIGGAVVATALAAAWRELYNVWRAGWAWSAWSWSDIGWTAGGGLVVTIGAAHGARAFPLAGVM